MNLILPLMQREWMQHRFSWMLLALIPVSLAVLGLGFGQLEIDVDGASDKLPPAAALALSTFAVSAAVMLFLVLIASLVTVIGLARRDHADRSIEFWLSLPIGHSRSLAVPLAVHLVLAPLAAVLLGLIAGAVCSMLLVSRVHSLGEWMALPWGTILSYVLVGLSRLVLGWPLALLWLSPLVLVAMLMFAWMRRWGPVVMGVVIALSYSPLGVLWGQPLLPRALAALGEGAARSLVYGQRLQVSPESIDEALRLAPELPLWLAKDVGSALMGLASPVLAGALLVSGLCFAGLVHWRRRGSSAAI